MQQWPLLLPHWWVPCSAAVGGRLLLAAAGVGEALLWRPEVSTPANSLLKTREGVRLLQLGASPYAGTSCHVPPLWLALSSPWAAHPLLYVVPAIACDLVAAGALYSAAVAVLGRSSSSSSSHSRDAPWLRPRQLALLYLFNPFVALSCVAGTLTSAENAAVMLAVAGGCTRNGPLAGAALAAGAYLGLHPLLLLVPVLLLLWRGPEDVLQNVAAAHQQAAAQASDTPQQPAAGDSEPGGSSEQPPPSQSQLQWQQRLRQRRRPAAADTSSKEQQALQQSSSRQAHVLVQQGAGVKQPQPLPRLGPCVWCVGTFVCCAAALLLLSDRVLLQHAGAQCVPQLRAWLLRQAGGAGLAPPPQQLAQCWAGRVYGLRLRLQDLTPTIGLWWYFFTEVFAEFTPFFLFVFHSFSVALALPLALRFPRRPLLVAWAVLFVSALFQPYACVGDMALWLALLPLLQQQLQSMRLRMFLVNSFVLLLVLGPAMWHQWIAVDAANANFFYSITLLLGVWSSVFLMQMLRLTALVDRACAGKGPAPRRVPAETDVGRRGSDEGKAKPL